MLHLTRFIYTYIHTYIHTHTHIHTHTYTHTYIHTHQSIFCVLCAMKHVSIKSVSGSDYLSDVTVNKNGGHPSLKERDVAPW